jgi:hypothetical protein
MNALENTAESASPAIAGRICAYCHKPFDPSNVPGFQPGKSIVCSLACGGGIAGVAQAFANLGAAMDAAPQPTDALALNHIAPPPGLDVTDEANADLVAMLDRSYAIEDILIARDDVLGFLASFDAQLAAARWRLKALEAITNARMRDDRATKVFAPSVGWRATIKPGKKGEPQRRIDVLRKFADLKKPNGDPLIPEDELRKAIWCVTPDPEWKTHLTYLRKLADYGAAAQKLLEEGLIDGEEGPPVLEFARVESPVKNVTPIGGAK